MCWNYTGREAIIATMPDRGKKAINSNRPRASVCRHLAFFVLIVGTAGCGEPEIEIKPPLNVRSARVLLASSVEGVRVKVNGPFTLCSATDDTVLQDDYLDWTEIGFQQALYFGEHEVTDSEPLTLNAVDYGSIHLSVKRNGKYLPSKRYAGSLRISLGKDYSIRVINVVDVESYVAGVVPNEASRRFGAESLKGQAIVARTYVLYIMAQRAGREFDVGSSEAAQVYGGIGTSSFARRACEAVEETRGVVLSESTPEGDRIFCTYYSSVCGGLSQSLSDVQPGKESGPLKGGVKCDYCSIAGKGFYRWDTAEISKAKLLVKLKSRYSQVEKWEAITSVTATRITASGRIAEVTVTGAEDETFSLVGERFRLAVGSRLMRSTDCKLIDDKEIIRLEDGKGFGHGLGLCQWGMEGQARQGKKAGEILRYYYPGSKLVRAY